MGDSVMSPAWGYHQDWSLTPDRATKTEIVITRKEAIEAAGDLFEKLGRCRTYNQGDLREAMRAWLTEERIIVMPDPLKDKLYAWCSQYDTRWLTFITSSTEDLTRHTYFLEDQVTGRVKDQGMQIRAVAQATKELHTRRTLLAIAKQFDDAAHPAYSPSSECKEQVQNMLQEMRTSRVHDQELVTSMGKALTKNRELTSSMESMIEELCEAQAQQQDITMSLEESRDFYIRINQSLRDTVKELKTSKEPIQRGRKRARVDDVAVSRVDSISAPRMDNTPQVHNPAVPRAHPSASLEQIMDMGQIASRIQEGFPLQAFLRLARTIMSEEQFRQFGSEHRARLYPRTETGDVVTGEQPSVVSRATSESSEDVEEFYLKNARW